MAEIKGGEKLERALAAISKNASKPSKLRVGFLANATFPDGTSVAMVAAIQEFGAPRARIPSRPFFRTMVAAKSPGWPKAVTVNLKAENYDATKTMMLVGEGIKGQLQQSIVDTNEPALRPITLMLRKMRSENQALVVTGRTVAEAAQRVAAGESTDGVSTKPLVDSGHMLNSVDYDVKS